MAEKKGFNVMRYVFLSLTILCLLLIPAINYGAELGRTKLSGGTPGSALGRVSADDIPTESVSVKGTPGRAGIQLDLTWNKMKWEIGDADFKDDKFSPEISIFYMLGEFIDLRIAGRYWQMDENVDGEDAEANIFRFGVGSKAWLPLNSRFTPYISCLLGYYFINVDYGSHSVDVDDNMGITIEGGISYLINEYWSLQLNMNFDSLLGEGDIKIDGIKNDFKFHSYGFGLGTIFFF